VGFGDILGCVRGGLRVFKKPFIKSLGRVFLNFVGTIEGVLGCLWVQFRGVVGRFISTRACSHTRGFMVLWRSSLKF
jgi:hypothetical protein